MTASDQSSESERDERRHEQIGAYVTKQGGKPDSEVNNKSEIVSVMMKRNICRLFRDFKPNGVNAAVRIMECPVHPTALYQHPMVIRY